MLLKLKERFGEYSLVAIQPSMLAAYRDERLRAVGPQTVTHELGLVNRVFKACQLDWGIPLPQGIPTAGIRKPKLPPGRDRRLEGDEEAILLRSLGQLGTPWMKAAFVLAVETAARRSELLSLAWQEVDLTRRVARIRGVDGRATKNDQRYRDVPLSTRAVATLAQLPRSTTGRVLPITADALDSAWDRLIARCRREHVHGVLTRKLEEQGIDAAREIRALVYKKRAPLDMTLKLLAEVERMEIRFLDLHWHDLRHEAVSRLAERLQMHELMKVTGQKTAKMVARYYHPRAEDLAAKLG
jgi:integrase